MNVSRRQLFTELEHCSFFHQGIHLHVRTVP